MLLYQGGEASHLPFFVNNTVIWSPWQSGHQSHKPILIATLVLCPTEGFGLALGPVTTDRVLLMGDKAPAWQQGAVWGCYCPAQLQRTGLAQRWWLYLKWESILEWWRTGGFWGVHCFNGSGVTGLHVLRLPCIELLYWSSLWFLLVYLLAW